MTRVFLWHKDTDPYDAKKDERIQSAGYYDYVKLLSSSPSGCLDRIYDMKIDPTEQFNLLSHKNGIHKPCRFNYDSPHVDIPTIISLFNKDAIHNHYCHQSHHNTGRYHKLNEILQVHSKSTAGIETSIPGHPVKSCDDFYQYYLALKIQIIWKKVVSFVKTGNLAHLKYLKDDADKAICVVPMVSQIKPFDFGQVCPSNTPYGCSIPEF
jgi:hypothetical protein